MTRKELVLDLKEKLLKVGLELSKKRTKDIRKLTKYICLKDCIRILQTSTTDGEALMQILKLKTAKVEEPFETVYQEILDFVITKLGYVA